MKIGNGRAFILAKEKTFVALQQRVLVLLICLICLGQLPGLCQPTALHNGDRVLFYGDSITAQRFYTRYSEDFLLTRYPGMQVNFVNAGVPGDTVYGGYTGDQATRLKRDVFPNQPTVITIMLGMNDGYYVPFEQKYFDIYKTGYRALLASMQSNLPAARITLITPTPYDEVTHGTEFAHYNEVVSRHAGFVRELAATSRYPESDFYAAIADLAKKGAAKNNSLAALLIPDRIHPSEFAHWVMAAALAKTWGFSPIVSSVSLDASEPAVLSAENANISSLEKDSGGLHWTQLDKALPLPLPLENEMMQFVLSTSDLAAMDQQFLRVKSLPAGHYRLAIDHHVIGSFTPEEFANGINLALYATPMQNKAKEIDGMALERAQLDQAEFILWIDDSKSSPDAVTMKTIEAKKADLLEVERKTSQPLQHSFEISPEY